MSGTPQNAQFEDIATYPDKSIWGVIKHSEAAYYGFGTLALDGHIYQYLSTPKTYGEELRFAGAKLIYSPDHGRTWHNQDRSTPVVWEPGSAQSRQNMVFFEEPQEAQDIAGRAGAHTFPRGWVNKTIHPYAWHPSVVYNAPLGLYLMANWGMSSTPEGKWFAKPNYLVFWTAPNPWGLWTQIDEETAWMPGNDPAARAYQPQIAPNGSRRTASRSGWWTDFQHTRKFWSLLRNAAKSDTEEEFVRLLVKIAPVPTALRLQRAARRSRHRVADIRFL